MFLDVPCSNAATSVRLTRSHFVLARSPARSYSDEFKYRPAASPVITEYLKDGRIRIRGASVGGIGVREEDVPKTPAQLALEREKRVEEARAAAKAKLKEAKAARAEKKKKSSSRKRSGAKKAKKVKTEI